MATHRRSPRVTRLSKWARWSGSAEAPPTIAPTMARWRENPGRVVKETAEARTWVARDRSHRERIA